MIRHCPVSARGAILAESAIPPTFRRRHVKVLGTCATNIKTRYSWRCILAKGRYTLKVYATGNAGNAQSKVGKSTLTVK